MSASTGLATALSDLAGCRDAVALLAALPASRLREPHAAEGFLLLVDGLRQRLEMGFDELSCALAQAGMEVQC